MDNLSNSEEGSDSKCFARPASAAPNEDQTIQKAISPGDLHLTIPDESHTDFPTSPSSDGSDLILSPTDRARRAKIFENCFGSASIEPSDTESKFKLAVQKSAQKLSAVAMFTSFNDSIDNFSEEDVLSGIGERSNLFAYPHKPIEQSQLRDQEVEIEKKKKKRSISFSHTESDGAHGAQSSVSSDIGDKVFVESPFYHRINLHGEDNFCAGVNRFLYVR